MTRYVNYVGQADTTGYGRATAQYLRLLSEVGVTVGFQPLLAKRGYEPVPWLSAPEEFRRHSVGRIFPDADTILHTVPEYFQGLAQSLRAKGVGGRMLGMTVWETSRLPSHWPAILNRLDGVIVPSPWNKEIFTNSGVTTSIYCLPHASEFEGVPPGPDAIGAMRGLLPGLEEKFIFYSIAAWTYRKGNDLLLRAYRKAFRGRRDVALVLKTSPLAFGPHLPLHGRVLRKLRLRREFRPEELTSPKDPPVIIITDDLPTAQLAALHFIGDCYVSCTHGEGWGLGLYEAAWFGKPILAPDRGGHLAYLPPGDQSGLIASRDARIPWRARDQSYTRDQYWVDVDLDRMVGAMQEIVQSPEPARSQARERLLHMRQHVSSKQIATALLRILEPVVS